LNDSFPLFIRKTHSGDDRVREGAPLVEEQQTRNWPNRPDHHENDLL